MGNLVDHAERELKRSGLLDEDSDYGGMLGESVLKLIRDFSEEGHSGASAGFAVSVFEKLARYEPLTPLTGEDDEWKKVEYGCEPAYQNIRCGHVFKDSDGRTYDSTGRVFRDKDGDVWVRKGSAVDITFPYIPKKEYVDVDEI